MHRRRGSPKALDLALRLTRKCGTVQAVGVYAERAEVHMGLFWIKSLRMCSGHANVIGHIDRVLALMSAGVLDPEPLVTHHMSLDDAPEAYALYDRHEALKIVLRPEEPEMSTTTIELPEALGSEARAFIAGTHSLLIGSERPAAADGRTFATLDPATGRELARVPQAGAEDVDRAVRAAREAFEEGPWATMPPSGRERVIGALAQSLEEHAVELAQIESLTTASRWGSRSSWTSPAAPGTCATSRGGRRRSRATCCR